MNIDLSNRVLYDTSIKAANDILKKHWNVVYSFITAQSFFDGGFGPKNEDYLKSIDLIAKGFAIIDISQNSRTPKSVKKELINKIENEL